MTLTPKDRAALEAEQALRRSAQETATHELAAAPSSPLAAPAARLVAEWLRDNRLPYLSPSVARDLEVRIAGALKEHYDDGFNDGYMGVDPKHGDL